MPRMEFLFWGWSEKWKATHGDTQTETWTLEPPWRLKESLLLHSRNITYPRILWLLAFLGLWWHNDFWNSLFILREWRGRSWEASLCLLVVPTLKTRCKTCIIRIWMNMFEKLCSCKMFGCTIFLEFSVSLVCLSRELHITSGWDEQWCKP